MSEHVIDHGYSIVCCGRRFGSEVFAGVGFSYISSAPYLLSPGPMTGWCAAWNPPLLSCSEDIPWRVVFDEGLWRVVFDEGLFRFVDMFRGDWPMDVDETRVLRAITHCISLDNFMMTLDRLDPSRDVMYRWLYPSVPRGISWWSCISPLNRLYYVLLSMKSRYAAMAASAMLPSLYGDSTPHATAGIVLQGFLEYVDTHGIITWKHFVNIGNQPLPLGRLSMPETVCWILASRYQQCLENFFLWCRDIDGEAPPQKFPYAIR